jgi:hypothetical protein
MVAKKAGKKVKTLPTKALSSKKAGTVKGGDMWSAIGDIKGESIDSNHKDWVTVLKYDHK